MKIEIELRGEHLVRYKKWHELRLGIMGAPERHLVKTRIQRCHLTPRQKQKRAEMDLEGNE